MNYVTGIDLSLTATGLATTDLTRSWKAPHYYTDTFKPPAKMDGLERIEWILQAVDGHTGHNSLIVIEGPAYGAKGRAVHQIAGLWWIVRRALHIRGKSVAVVPPFNLKKYATGTTKASKDMVLMAAARRFPDFDGDNNAADALFLAAMGAEHLGRAIIALPMANKEALKGVAWPDLPGDNS